MAFDGDVGPLRRRFLEIKVKDKKLKLPKKGKINKKTDDAIELTTELLLTQASCMEDTIGNTLQDTSKHPYKIELEEVEEELKWLKTIHLTSDSKESDSEEELSYIAFAEDVSTIARNRTATSSPKPTAATAHAEAAEKSDENKKDYNEEPGPSNKTSNTTKDTTQKVNQTVNNTLTRTETEEAVKWLEDNQNTWLKKPHLMPLLDSSKDWEALTLSEMMTGETSLMNNITTNLQH